MVFGTLVGGLPDFCSSTGCLSGQVALSGQSKSSAASKIVVAKGQSLAQKGILPIPPVIRARPHGNAARGMPGDCPVFELSAECLPTDTGSRH